TPVHGVSLRLLPRRGDRRGLLSFPTRRSSDLPPTIADHRTAPVNALGYLRVMFTVEDIDEMIARLTKRGAQLVGEVVQYEDTYRSEEHTSELQSREKLVCRLLLEKKKPASRTR